MNLNKLTPLLRTTQLKETVDWYVNELGFTCTDFVPAWGFVPIAIGMQLHNADIMLATPIKHIIFDTPSFTGSLYINTNNTDACWEKLKDKCKVCYAIETFDYGMREFGVYDINGYLLQFGQPVYTNE
ncbi:MAG: hypothetical protein K2X48_05165 [Chitinophagaceae bacterium]|nr:hypothetical protein [Chitinophagaceae bacterium]